MDAKNQSDGSSKGELTEWLLHNDLRIFLWPVDDGRRNEIAITVGVLATNCHIQLLLFNVAEEAFDPLILHRILNGTEVNAFFMPFAEFEAGGVLGNCIAEWLDDLLVDEDTLDGKAELDVSA